MISRMRVTSRSWAPRSSVRMRARAGTGRVEDFAAVADRVLDVFDQARVIAEIRLGQLEQRRRLVLQRAEAASPGARRAHGRRHVEQVLGAERAADSSALRRGPHVVDAAHVQAGPQPGQLQRFSGGCLAPPGLLELERWLQLEGKRAACRKAGVARELLADRVELERVDAKRERRTERDVR